MRPAAALAAAVAAALSWNCASGRSALAPQASDAIVLLGEPDGSGVGRAVVSNGDGAVDLTRDREFTRVAARGSPTPAATMSEAEVMRIFGDALAAQPPAPQRFSLYFRFESDELTSESASFVAEILRIVHERPVPEVVAIGHTDTMGATASNFDLGLRRAMTLRRLLVDAGLDPALIQVMSLGETEPVVPTPDETPEPRNRRVEVAIR